MYNTDQLNTALADRYAIERLLGEGGMATVYLARDLKHNRKVALKVLKPDLGAVLGVERFLAEIEVTANLQHPNLLPLFDSGSAGDLLFYVMPYVEGESLRARLARDKQLPVDEAVRIASAVASALDYAHRHNVIHRDLKPENILLHDGHPVVADFGIALALSKAGGNRITQTGLSLGTPQYMSPEQATGDRTIDARTDIYSLGAVAYEMLTGEPPHVGATSQAIIARVLSEKPRSIRTTRPSVPPHVEAAIGHALEKLAPDRFATAREFGDALTGVRPFSATTTPTPRDDGARAKSSIRLRELIAWSVAAIGVGTAAWKTFQAQRPLRQAPQTEFVVGMPEGLAVSAVSTNASIALSEDGSTMVFQGSRGDGQGLYLRRLNDRTVQLIGGTEGGSQPELSPDGSEVLFRVGRVLNRVSVLGGTPKHVADSAGLGTSWGTNHTIVYAIRRGLYIGSDAGEAPRVLAMPDSSRRHVVYSWPRILPGGKAALITIGVGDNQADSSRLGIVSLADGRVTEFNPTIRGTNPRYSSTGHILYVPERDAALVAAPFSLRSLEVTGAPFRIAESIWVGFNGGAAFAVGEGGTIAFRPLGATPDRELVVVNRAGVATPTGIPLGNYQGPRWSPDGRQIAVTDFTVNISADQVGPNSDIWRIDLGTGIRTRVTTDGTSLRPEWSADGERIAYVKLGDSLVMWRSINSTAAPTPVVRSALAISTFDLGRTHGHVALSASNNAVTVLNDIFTSPMDSLVQPRPFQAESYIEANPRITSDERRIAYVTNRTGRNEVYVRAFLADGREEQVSSGGGTEPIWSRDGRELFYRVPGYMMSARFADGERPAVVRRDTLFPDIFLRSPSSVNYDVSPDGKSFMMLRRPPGRPLPSPSIVVIANWRPRSGRANEGR